MAVTTYAELQSAVADWLNRSDLEDRIKDFIAFTEARWKDRLRARDMITRSTLSASSQYTNLPSDFLEMHSVYVASPYPKKLEVLSKEQIDQMREKYCDTAGPPKYYAIDGTDIEVFPTPSSATTLNIAYYAAVPALDDDNTSNWVLAKYPELYVHGALIASAPFLNDDSRLELWINVHDSRLEEINQAGKKAQHSGSRPRQRAQAIG